MTRKFKGKRSLLHWQAPEEEANGKSQKCIVTIDLEASARQLLDMSYPPSNEGKS